LIGHRHDTGGRTGRAIFESDSAVALQGYAGQWSPHLDIEITPVVEDEEAAQIGAAAAAAQPQ
jgi:hypothetical protein